MVRLELGWPMLFKLTVTWGFSIGDAVMIVWALTCVVGFIKQLLYLLCL